MLKKVGGERVSSSVGWGRQLCQLGPPTLSVGVLHHPPSKSYIIKWLSRLFPVRRTPSIGGKLVPIGTTRRSHPIPSVTPYHSVIMEACPSCHDNVVPYPFTRIGR
jgi:hypothetical protein